MYKKTTSLYFLKKMYCLHQRCVCRSLLTSGAFSNIENSRESCEESTIECSGKDKIIPVNKVSSQPQDPDNDPLVRHCPNAQ